MHNSGRSSLTATTSCLLRCQTVIGGVHPPQLHPLNQIWPLLAPTKTRWLLKWHQLQALKRYSKNPRWLSPLFHIHALVEAFWHQPIRSSLKVQSPLSYFFSVCVCELTNTGVYSQCWFCYWETKNYSSQSETGAPAALQPLPFPLPLSPTLPRPRSHGMVLNHDTFQLI